MVDYLRRAIEALNTGQALGKDWRFIHARRDYSNLIADKYCGVSAILEVWSQVSVFSTDEATGISDLSRLNLTFELFLGFQSGLDLPYDNETKQPEDGRYSNFIEPLQNFIKEGLPTLDCDLVLTQWVLRPKINYKDINMDGVMITGTISQHFD